MASSWQRLGSRVREDGVGSVARSAARRVRGASSMPPHTPPPVVDDLRGWCDAHPGSEYHTLLPAEPILRGSRPRTIEPTVDDVFTQYYDVDAPEHALVGIPGGMIATNGVVLLPDGSLVGDSVTFLPEYRALILEHEPAYTRPLPERRRAVEGSAYSLVIGNVGNYFHWMQDVMMRLPAAVDLLPDDVRFVVPAGLAGYHLAMLDALGLGDVERVEMAHGELLACERLYVASPYLKPMLHTARFMVPFAQRCRARFGVQPGPADARIYISRRHDKHWSVVNEDDVERALVARGFTAYDLGRLSFGEQVALFSRAEVVVGTGAGLSNLVFAPAGTTVLQLQDPSFPVGHQYTIADSMGHEYWYFFCDAVPNPQSQYGRANLHVPVAKLEQCLDAAGV